MYDYDDEAVWYCKDCLRLTIVDGEVPYCSYCGSVDIGEVGIREWEEMWRERYGEWFLTNK